MEVFGNAKSLMNEIEHRYNKEIAKLDLETERSLAELKKKAEEEIGFWKSKYDLYCEAEAKKRASRIISEEKLKAKKEYEQVREDLINEVLLLAEKQAGTFAHSKSYIDFVKKNIPPFKEYNVIAGSEKYSQAFPKSNIAVDTSIQGIKIEKDGVVYDFSVSSALQSKREALRRTISTTIQSQ